MKSDEIRRRFIAFFEKRGHAVIPSASLVPENDPTTLFTGSGMQPMIPYLLGAAHPKGTRLVDSQKSFRTGDIDEVGDNRHTTFFEMLGNWSLGDYFKKEQLSWIFEFLTEEIGLDPERLFVSVFIGHEKYGFSKDTESVAIWKRLFKERGIEALDVEIGSEENGYIKGMRGGRIFYYDAAKNWWSRAGIPENMPVGEPGGPDSEIFYDFGTPHDAKYGNECHPNCDCGRFLEIGNSVFMEYQKESDEDFIPLKQKNVDFGGGLERITMAANKISDVIGVNHKPIIEHLEKISGKAYGEKPEETRAFRIIADHIKASVFLISDNVFPSNSDQGYFVRRLIRRSVRYADRLGIQKSGLSGLVDSVVQMYQDSYPEILEKNDLIKSTIQDEENKFRKTLKEGLKQFERGEDPFVLFTTYGFPFELTKELASEKGATLNEKDFEEKFRKHQELSRAGSEQKFKGGLADTSEKTTMLHTCTHLMLAGLRKYLGTDIHQGGSNITAERTRFDFNYPQKVSPEVLKQGEEYVNEAISKKCDVVSEQMPKGEAQKKGVEGSFWEKYPDTVNVYTVKCSDGTVYSAELCGGPHVKNTSDIKGHFKITKEESSSAGIRRIKAVLE
jgi:alanyl-tRNA synthetase